jgi:phage terminase large subunit-like protein
VANKQSDSSAWAQALARWKADPVAFIAEVLREPRSGKPYHLFPEQERFIRTGFTLTHEGRLPYDTAVYATPKKNGKSTTGAMLAVYAAVVLGGRFAAVYILANDEEQSVGIIFELAKRMIAAAPLLRDTGKITQTRIDFP